MKYSKSLAATVAAIALLAPATAAQAVGVPPPPSNGPVVFARDTGFAQDLYAVDPDGSNIRRLTTAGVTEREPAVSADGRRVAYLSFGATGSDTEIFVMDVDGSDQTQLTDNDVNDFNPAISPDGSVVVFSRPVPGASTELYALDVATGAERRLTNDALDDVNPSFGADGDTIVFARNPTAAAVHDIAKISLAAGGSTIVGGTTGDDAAPSLSPDGATIAFTGAGGNDRRIYLMPSSGGTASRLTTRTVVEDNASWSPDGTRLTFDSFAGSPSVQPKLFTAASDGTDVQQLTPYSPFEAEKSDRDPSWGAAEPPPAVSVDDVSVSEGGDATFTVTLSRAASGTVTVAYATADATATQPGDYSAASGTLTFAAGETSKTVTVSTNGDALDEPDETFDLQLSGAAGATIGDGQGVGTIVDDDAAPAVSIGGAGSVAEGDSGTSNATFTATLSAASGRTVTVDVATADGTALQPADYAQTSAQVTFAPGETSKTFSAPVKGDTLDEPDEIFTANLSNGANATIGDGQGDATIADDDAAPGVSISDAGSVPEGDSGTTDATFTVTLSAASGRTVTVDVATADGTALQPADYAQTTAQVTFAPGETSKTFSALVQGDTLDEADETFTANLSNASNAAIADAQGIATISDDDDPPPPPSPALSVSDATVTEGDSGTANATFTVSLSSPPTTPVTVGYATVNGTAAQPADYAETSGTLAFATGETTKTVIVPVKGDTADEPDEEFFVNLSSPVGATIADGQGSATIADDDDAPLVSIGDATVTEGNSGTTNAIFALTLDVASGRSVTVAVATTDGTATQPQDYAQTTGTVTFAPGETTKSFAVAVKGDAIDEPDEAFAVDLTAPVNATIGRGHGTGTIVDDEVPAPRPADLSIGKTDGLFATVTRDPDADELRGQRVDQPDRRRVAPDPFVGERITYTIVVNNKGPNPSAGTVVSDPLPAEVQFVSVDPSQGRCAGGRQVRCELGTVPTGAGAKVKVVTTATAAGDVRNVAAVTSDTTDPQASNDRAAVTTHVKERQGPPIIFIPGYEGSKIDCQGRELWPNLDSFPFSGPDLEHMQLNYLGTGPADRWDEATRKNVPVDACTGKAGPSGGLVQTLFGRDIYAGTAANLSSLGRRSYTFAYDWRKSPEASLSDLDRLVDQARAETGASKVTLYGHNSGGLLARWYIDDRLRADKVVRLLTVGTPYWGAPKAFLPTFMGQGFQLSQLVPFVDSRTMKTFARNIAGQYYLYPSPAYGGWMAYYTSPDQFRNDSLMLEGEGHGYFGGKLFEKAHSDHDRYIDGFKTNGVDYQVLAGSGINTPAKAITQFAICQDNFIPELGDSCNAFEYAYADGDGLAPLFSAFQTSPADPLHGIGKAHGEKIPLHYACDVNNIGLATDRRVFDRIAGFLRDGSPIKGDTGRCPAAGSQVVVTGSHPADIDFDVPRGPRYPKAAGGQRAAATSISLAAAESAGFVTVVERGGRTVLMTNDRHPVGIRVHGSGLTVAITRVRGSRQRAGRSYGPFSGTAYIGPRGRATRHGRRLRGETPDHKPPVTRVRVRRAGRYLLLTARARDRSRIRATVIRLPGRRYARWRGRVRVRRSAARRVRFASVDVFGNAERPRRLRLRR